jgi:predicted GIY-YIG superfamily endonuclease
VAFHVYILKSDITGTLFIGHTANIERTLQEHNDGKCLPTMSKRPWTLIYKEECSNPADAATREKFYKSAEGQSELKEKGVM